MLPLKAVAQASLLVVASPFMVRTASFVLGLNVTFSTPFTFFVRIARILFGQLTFQRTPETPRTYAFGFSTLSTALTYSGRSTVEPSIKANTVIIDFMPMSLRGRNLITSILIIFTRRSPGIQGVSWVGAAGFGIRLYMYSSPADHRAR